MCFRYVHSFRNLLPALAYKLREVLCKKGIGGLATSDMFAGCGNSALFWLTFDQVRDGRRSVQWIKQAYDTLCIQPVLSKGSVMGLLREYAKKPPQNTDDGLPDHLILLAEEPR